MKLHVGLIEGEGRKSYISGSCFFLIYLLYLAATYRLEAESCLLHMSEPCLNCVHAPVISSSFHPTERPCLAAVGEAVVDHVGVIVLT